MHQADRHIETGGCIDSTVGLQGIDIVYQTRTRGDRGLHDFRFPGINGNGYGNGFLQCFDNRNDTAQFFSTRDGVRTGPGGFPANIDNRSTLLDHSAGLFCRFVGRKKMAPVREGIGGDIQYTHDSGLRQVQ